MDIYKFVKSLQKVNFLETYLNKTAETKKTEDSKPAKTEKPVAQKAA